MRLNLRRQSTWKSEQLAAPVGDRFAPTLTELGPAALVSVAALRREEFANPFDIMGKLRFQLGH